jgi:mono-ADP-ribosyltransferase sirtuin 6
MSLGYAEKLSYREDLGGRLGAPEVFEPEEVTRAKVRALAGLVRAARRVVAFTGAGISTSCGIPDFRGPQGVWTLQRAGKPLPQAKVPFFAARPSATHMALKALVDAGKVTFVVTQNVDSLHRRSGVPRAKCAELHGCVFQERCEDCRAEYVRDFEVESVGFKRTGRRCAAAGCDGALRDFVHDWEDALDADDLAASEDHARRADLALCLGTSLQITPACNLPLRATRAYREKPEAGKLAICCLQRTQHDNRVARSGGLVLRARCDEVMAALMAELGLPIPRYERRDAFALGHELLAVRGDGGGFEFVAFVRSPDGAAAATPMLRSVEFSFEDGGAPVTVSAPPFSARRSVDSATATVHVTLRLDEAADADKREHAFEITASASEREARRRVEVLSQVVEYGPGAAAAAPAAAADAAGAEPAEALEPESKRPRV